MAITTKPAAGWNDIGTEFTDRVVFVDIIGLTGSGRTKFALSAPGPIALIHAHEKIGGLAQSVVKSGKKIREHRFGFAPTGNMEADRAKATAVWLDFRSKFVDAQDNWAKSIVVDTGNEAWELARYKAFGQEAPKGNRMDMLYGPVNRDFRNLFNERFRLQNKCNLLTVHQMGDKWVDRLVDGTMKSFRTGGMERKGGFREIPIMADVIIEMVRGDTDLSFNAIIRKGYFNASVEGMLINGSFMQDLGFTGLNFPSVMAMIAETPESDWT